MTTMSEHTTGPLQVRVGENCTFHDTTRVAITKQTQDGAETVETTVAEVWPTPGTDQDIADAHLIAAAPELCEAAKRAEAWFSTPTEDYPPEEASSDIVDALRNALAKAEGGAC